MDIKQIEKSKRLRVKWLADCREIINYPDVYENVFGFSHNAGNIFRDNVGLGMMTWREGGSPRPFFEEAIDDIVKYRDDLLSRGMTTAHLPIDTAIFIASLLDRQSEFVLGECELDVCGDLFLDCHLAKGLLGQPIDASIRSGFERLRKAKRHALAIRTYETYFHLMALEATSSSITQAVASADANYAARRKDAYYSGGPDIEGGGDYNDMVIDYRLSAILKYRGIEQESLHRWRW
jgi:hypothetical protein